MSKLFFYAGVLFLILPIFFLSIKATNHLYQIERNCIHLAQEIDFVRSNNRDIEYQIEQKSAKNELSILYLGKDLMMR